CQQGYDYPLYSF
nr:immunoglobulin light chain junction region [Macaca mulatta]MOV63001.1 immunoglobulin light chain junction region [Macaca mulatta]MOV63417.1 immunoglobulin light chain junction region [Macaca mulatta]